MYTVQVDEQSVRTWKHLTFRSAVAPCLEIKTIFNTRTSPALKTQICSPAIDLTLAVVAAEERAVGAVA